MKTLFLMALCAVGYSEAANVAYKSDVSLVDYIGSIGMSGTGDWSAGTTLYYAVTHTPDLADGTPNYIYSYLFWEYGSDSDDGVNTMLLEFSVSCNTDPLCYRDDPHMYQAGDIAHLPASINAAEYDSSVNGFNFYGFHFQSNRPPVWGNFFALGDAGNAWSYNPGLVNESSTNKYDFIPRPDGDTKPAQSQVPEPGTIGLFLVSGCWLAPKLFRARTRETP